MSSMSMGAKLGKYITYPAQSIACKFELASKLISANEAILHKSGRFEASIGRMVVTSVSSISPPL